MDDVLDTGGPARRVDRGARRRPDDPLTRPLARVRDGRPPVRPDELAVSPTALRRLGTRIGDPVRTIDGATYRVVGVVEYPDNLRDVITLPAVTPDGTAGSDTWLVDLPGPLEPGLADRLNAQGVQVVARSPLPGRQEFSRGMFTGRRRGGRRRRRRRAGPAGGGAAGRPGLRGERPAPAAGPRTRRGGRWRRLPPAPDRARRRGGARRRRGRPGHAARHRAAFAGRPIVEQYLLGERLGAYRIFPAALVAIAATAVLAGCSRRWRRPGRRPGRTWRPAWPAGATRPGRAAGCWSGWRSPSPGPRSPRSPPVAPRRPECWPASRWANWGWCSAPVARRRAGPGRPAAAADPGSRCATPAATGLGRARHLGGDGGGGRKRRARRLRGQRRDPVAGALATRPAAGERAAHPLGETPADPPSAEVVADRARAVLPGATVVSVATPGAPTTSGTRTTAPRTRSFRPSSAARTTPPARSPTRPGGIRAA
ncbi:hypothetical protein V2I01_23215 [Micromonospora sp. BRA006-A]|nr:hypothetical protein [Micromonospora sp. BRA006-A]